MKCPQLKASTPPPLLLVLLVKLLPLFALGFGRQLLPGSAAPAHACILLVCCTISGPRHATAHAFVPLMCCTMRSLSWMDSWGASEASVTRNWVMEAGLPSMRACRGGWRAEAWQRSAGAANLCVRA